MENLKQFMLGLFQPNATMATPAALVKLERNGLMEYGTLSYGRRYLQTHALRLHPDPDIAKPISDLLPLSLRDDGALPPYVLDSLPDTWGRLVVATANPGVAMDNIELLKRTNANRVGAVVVMHDQPETQATMSLAELFEGAMNIQYAIDVPADIRRLLTLGGSLGGARPKASLMHNGALWLAKFAMREDTFDCQRVEAATLSLAKKCGLRCSEFETQTVHRSTALLVKRFDRQQTADGECRIHFLSGSGLLNLPFKSGMGSYVELAKALTRFGSAPAQDCQELFRRMLFNILIDNTDDHLKNHGFLHDDKGKYRLAPLYDVLPQATGHGYMGLALVGNNDAPSIADLQANAHAFHLRPPEVIPIFEALLRQIQTQWQSTMLEEDVEPRDLARLARTLAPLHQRWQARLRDADAVN